MYDVWIPSKSCGAWFRLHLKVEKFWPDSIQYQKNLTKFLFCTQFPGVWVLPSAKQSKGNEIYFLYFQTECKAQFGCCEIIWKQQKAWILRVARIPAFITFFFQRKKIFCKRKHKHVTTMLLGFLGISTASNLLVMVAGEYRKQSILRRCTR